jgi:hypothetical protein
MSPLETEAKAKKPALFKHQSYISMFFFACFYYSSPTKNQEVWLQGIEAGWALFCSSLLLKMKSKDIKQGRLLKLTVLILLEVSPMPDKKISLFFAQDCVLLATVKICPACGSPSWWL